MNRRYTLFLILAALFLIPLLSACTGTSNSNLPDYLQAAPQPVQVAYNYAVEHPDMLVNQPCYCGCGAMGHLSNRDCFIQAVDEVGTVTYESHASGCGICVDIALDVKRMDEEGWSPLQIRLYIDATYSQYGPSTDTPMPEA